MTRKEMEERLINFSILIYKLVDEIPEKRERAHLSNQLIRSGTSPALNYGEAVSAESTKDFIHKLQIILKELRETFICLKILKQTESYKSEETINKALKENDELISIFVKSVITTKQSINR
ncbi:MAG: hypothetical protein A2161_10730 [Candidatus Schekmanbacteria bacterium RBG_13_48_7]|uniref:Four helix bundle protein n=1 Tax=Candidatus Schekmanbacteria bacterium RBG_13_48_7 TaxID=1817878 RepID=A0A1F7RVM1_9BACT|nr:MAG: hypothetical protein A2161_10730 [Candidatus Schekmanbacteria bacterium RBG_13_48_7]